MKPGLLTRINALGLATGVGILLLWELVMRVGLVDLEYLPMPSEISEGGWEIVENGKLFENLAHTLAAAVVGWLAAVVVGVALGTLIGLLRPVWTYTMASIDSLRSLPIVAFVPVAVLLFGFSMQTEILLAFYAALWPITLNTISGMHSLDQRKREVGRVLKLGTFGELWKLRLPAATPSIVVGLRLGISISLVLTLVAEMVGNPAGLGFALIQSAQALRPELMFAYIIAIGLTGIVLNALLQSGARLLFRGQMAAAGDIA
ncbi:ABC transporter permease [Pseudonocardia kunmingensis]|uniref:NitT/TauT family transport system permease protein n=1 Tax=Pseudonocardia kunmingensis TaxID=630975 RepID=A0A543DP01_9PSEU|nr:ABC transporter permease [Pseudonocardia kunmingensis]TQM11038.1 NitT/TauT family transport system permease protein [Pseudonocardia kunmingensis]